MSQRGAPWTDEEHKVVAEEYFTVLRAELAGQQVVKQKALDRAEQLLDGRTNHTIKDRCYRISEELQKRNIPWVRGWPPPMLAGQSGNSAGVSASIWRVIEPTLPTELPDLFGPTAEPGEASSRASRMTWITASSPQPVGSAVPAMRSAIGTKVVRDPRVIAWVKAQARGNCEKCGSPAPFVDAVGSPFLEVHHVRWLADGGSDTTPNAVALCPNCHRQCHHSSDPEAERRVLYRSLPRLVPE